MSDPRPVALVTGGSRGIGLASARALARDGHRLVLAARDAARLEAAADELRDAFPDVEVLTLATDVADEPQVKALFQRIQTTFKRLDVLINCAGILRDAALAMTRPDDLRQTFAVNVFGSYWCCQYGARLMARQRRGAIVNLASVVGEQGAAGQSAYAASKSAIDGLTRSLARELAPQGIRVNAVAPGLIDTDMTADYQGERRQAVVDKILLDRTGRADEVAELIAFLASERAGYVTGQVIPITGGLTL